MLLKDLAASAERRTCVLCVVSVLALLFGLDRQGLFISLNEDDLMNFRFGMSEPFARLLIVNLFPFTTLYGPAGSALYVVLFEAFGFGSINYRLAWCGTLLFCCVALYRLVKDLDGRATAAALVPIFVAFRSRIGYLMGLVRTYVNFYSITVGLVVLCWLVIASFRLNSPGLHYDEMIFVSGAFPEKPGGAVWKLGYNETTIAVMVMTYLGALKGWIYRALLLFVEPSAFTARFPVLLLTAITITLTYKLTSALFDRKTGLIAVVLLSTDVTFLLTSRMDWGPVVIQRLCLVAGALLVVRGHRVNSHARIAAGLSFFGLALFDKLIFVWILFGLLAALLITRRQALRVASIKRLPLYVLAIAIPASPVLFYRLFVAPPDRTTMEVHMDHLRSKYGMLQQSFDGTVLSGAIAYQSADRPAPALDFPTKALYWLAPDVPWLTGWFWPAVVFSLLAFPVTVFLPGGGNLAFILIFCLASWTPMALTEGAGSVHHSTLVYPFPHIFVAASFSSLAGKMSGVTGRKIAIGVIVIATALIAQANVKNIAHKYTEFIRFGGRPIWTEAIYDLNKFLEHRPEKRILIADWGIEHQLIFLSNNTMPLTSLPHAGPEDENALKAAVSRLEEPDTLVVQYASKDLSPSPMEHELLDEAARSVGVELRLLEVIQDRQGRDMFHVYSPRQRTDS